MAETDVKQKLEKIILDTGTGPFRNRLTIIQMLITAIEQEFDRTTLERMTANCIIDGEPTKEQVELIYQNNKIT